MDWTKSSYSGNGAACVEWRKSSHSGMHDCVEVATHDVVQVRDSKDPDGPVITFDPGAWMSFVDGIKAGQFDL